MSRIYVASLSDYNAGRLHGVWIDLEDKDTTDVWEEINAMLKTSPEAKAGYGPAEEFAIHDYEGFHSYRLHEYEGIDRTVKIANFLDEFGVAGAAFLDNDSSVLENDDLEEAFHESYAGCFEDEKDYAFSYIQDTGGFNGIPAEIFDEHYSIFDWEQIASELLQDAWTANDDNEGIHVFRSY